MRRCLGILVFLAGCAANTGTREQDASTDIVRTAVGPNEAVDLTRHTYMHSHEYAVPREHVWNSLLSLEEELGLPFESADTTSGTVVFRLQTATPRVAGRHASTYLDCGRGPGGTPRVDTYQLTLRLTANVETLAPNLTLVGTSLLGYARDRSTTADQIPCKSTGYLERRALALLTARLGS